MKTKTTIIAMATAAMLLMSVAPGVQAAPASHKQVCEFSTDTTDTVVTDKKKPDGIKPNLGDSPFLCVAAYVWTCAVVCVNTEQVHDATGLAPPSFLVSARVLVDPAPVTDENGTVLENEILHECIHKEKKNAGEVRDLQCGNTFDQRANFTRDGTVVSTPCIANDGDDLTVDDNVWINYSYQHTVATPVSTFDANGELFWEEDQGTWLSDFIGVAYPSDVTTFTVSVWVESNAGLCRFLDGNDAPITAHGDLLDGLRDDVRFDGVE